MVCNPRNYFSQNEQHKFVVWLHALGHLQRAGSHWTRISPGMSALQPVHTQSNAKCASLHQISQVGNDILALMAQLVSTLRYWTKCRCVRIPPKMWKYVRLQFLNWKLIDQYCRLCSLFYIIWDVIFIYDITCRICRTLSVVYLMSTPLLLLSVAQKNRLIVNHPTNQTDSADFMFLLLVCYILFWKIVFCSVFM